MLRAGRRVLPPWLSLLPRARTDELTLAPPPPSHPPVGVEDNLDALMARLSEGDRAAFEPLFRAFYPRALRLARVRLADADAQDAAQTALEKVFGRAREFTAGRRALPWFYAVVANEVHAIARRRAGSRERGEPPDGVEIVADGDPEADLLRAELRVALAEAVDGLDPVSAAAIAVLLGDGVEVHVTPVAHRKRLSRAYARLRQLLGRFHEHES